MSKNTGPAAKEEVAALVEIAKAATPGPWEANGGDAVWGVWFNDGCARLASLDRSRDGHQGFRAAAEADARFIATFSPEKVLALLQAYASETAAREYAEAARDEALTFVLNARSDQEATERSLGEALEGLRDISAKVLDDDHKRLCQGREYTCSCGYDDELHTQARTASDIYGRLKGEPTDTGVR